MERELGREGEFRRLRFVGIGCRIWEVGGYIEVEREGEEGVNGASGMGDGEDGGQRERQRLRKIWPVDLDAVKEIEIWKMDTLDVV